MRQLHALLLVLFLCVGCNDAFLTGPTDGPPDSTPTPGESPTPGPTEPPPEQQIWNLYYGGFDPGAIYRFEDVDDWQKISPDLGDLVVDLIYFDEELFAVVFNEVAVNWDGQVYAYSGTGTWDPVGDAFGSVEWIDLESFQGTLYAGVVAPGSAVGGLYRLDPTGWTLLEPTPAGWSGFRAVKASQVGGVDRLHLGDNLVDLFGYYEPASGFATTEDYGGSCIYDFEEINGTFWAGAYGGMLYSSTNGTNWTQINLQKPSATLWALDQFDGELHVGLTGPFDPGLYRRETSGALVKVSAVSGFLDRGIFSTVQAEDRLFFTTFSGAINDVTLEIREYDGTNVIHLGAETKSLPQSVTDPVGPGFPLTYSPIRL